MKRDYELINSRFEHVVLKGNSYEIGRVQGLNINNIDPQFVQVLGSTKINIKKLGFESLKELEDFYEINCPGINEELQGFADAIDVPKEKVHYFMLLITTN